MNAFEAEKLKQSVQGILSKSTSPRQRLIILKEYYSALISNAPKLVLHAYIQEFINIFIVALKKFEVFYFKPQLTKDIIDLLRKLKQFNNDELIIGEFENQINNLRQRLADLESVLDGKEPQFPFEKKVFFPLLERDINIQQNFLFGTLETLTIFIRNNKEKDEFIIVPSTEVIDEFLLNQVKISWQISVNYIRKRFPRVNKYHKVVIHFDHRWGNYTGSSLGAALTVSFIEELITFYNLSYVISINRNIALTGGFDESGVIKKLHEIIIDKKLEIIFYSFIKVFVVPEENKIYTQNKLEEFKQKYPNRDLKIIGVTDLDDLLDRRNLFDIKKQNPIIRTTKFAKKNWVVTSLILIILLLSGYFYEFNFDDNPAMLAINGNNILIENSRGKVLWSKKIEIDPQFAAAILKETAKIIKINSDKKNLVLISRLLQSELKNPKEYGSIFCFNYLGKELWHYQLKDTVKSYGENLEPLYECQLIDTISYGGKNLLVAWAVNDPSFSSAIFTLDLKTGKRVGTTFWNPGHISDAIITSIPGYHDMIVFGGSNNGYAKGVIGGIRLSELSGYAPSTHYYTFLGMKPANLAFYILIPKTDYLKHFNVLRTNAIYYGSIKNSEREGKIVFDDIEKDSREASLIYKLDYNLKDISIVVDSRFRIERDSLVAHGILNPPYTDTPQYCKLLEDHVLYWNGKKFVKKEKLK